MKTIAEAVSELRDYISADRIVRQNHTDTDFEKFCEGHCRDIEIVLDALESRERIADGKEI